MSRAKKALQAPSAADSRVLEPEPPKDLWQQLDAFMAQNGFPKLIEQPPDTFTAAQYAREGGLNPSSARMRIIRMKKMGKIEYVGKGVNNQEFYRIKK